MCRFLVYRGNDEIQISKLILDPKHSILKQSFDSRLRLDTTRGKNNADGFGIGFYTAPCLGAGPCIFTSTIPAWNCTNLHRIASKTASKLVFAHVRATTEGSVSEDNCHPFCHGSLMWMHNGGLGGWKYIKRRLGERLHDRWYLTVQGGTDSEWAFALFLDLLERLGVDPSSEPADGFGPMVLRKVLLQTIDIINELTTNIPDHVVQQEDVDTRSLLNFAVTDGHSIICTRYVSSKTDEAASLYYSSGTQWETRPSPAEDRDYQMERRDKGAGIVLVASEPLTFDRENWVNVPTNSILTIHQQSVLVQPIEDGFSESDPQHHRSSAFATDKGLTTNEKVAPVDLNRVMLSPSPCPEAEMQRRVYNTNGGLNLRSVRLLPQVRTSSPLSQSEVSPPSPARAVPAAVASRGNTKKKQCSLMEAEWAHPAEFLEPDGAEPTSDTPLLGASRKSEFGNHDKPAPVLGLFL